MSNKGIYTALSGAMAQSQRLDTIANNIANSSTTAFKKDEQTFREYLTAYEKVPDVIQVPKVPASIESFHHMQGGDKAYVDASGTYTDFSQGPLRGTGNPLDLALDGQGFFEVLTPQGVQLTRNGSFHMDVDGQLVNQRGYPVLREETSPGEPAQDRTIKISHRQMTVTFSGQIYENNRPVARISVIDVDKKEALQKMGNSLYQIKSNYQPTFSKAKAKVHQGHIEGSNVNIIREMTDMISATRAFESTQKAMKAFDEMNGQLAREVPRIR